jgi:hypothetical protein
MGSKMCGIRLAVGPPRCRELAAGLAQIDRQPPALERDDVPLLRFEWVELDERCPAGRGQGRAKPGGANP